MGSGSDFKRWLQTGPLVTKYNLRIPGSTRVRSAAQQWRLHDVGERHVEFWVERFAAVSRALRAREPSPPAFEYSYTPAPRFGQGLPAHRELDTIIGRGREGYAKRLRSFAPDREALERIPVSGKGRRSTREPCWDNSFLTGLDAVSLYALLRTSPSWTGDAAALLTQLRAIAPLATLPSTPKGLSQALARIPGISFSKSKGHEGQRTLSVSKIAQRTAAPNA